MQCCAIAALVAALGCVCSQAHAEDLNEYRYTPVATK
jgi:hypothetical protein